MEVRVLSPAQNERREFCDGSKPNIRLTREDEKRLSIFRRVTDEEECETCTESVRLESSPRHIK